MQKGRTKALISRLLCVTAVAPCVLGQPSAAAEEQGMQAERKPNIVLIVSDDQGYADVGCYKGDPRVRTPTLDRLADEGVRLTSFYVSSPVCTPSRASLLTGRYPRRNGLTKVLVADDYISDGLAPSEILLPELLKKEGYKTACIGKWHLGFADGMRPTERGFDEFFGSASGIIDYYSYKTRAQYGGPAIVPDLFRNIEPAQAEGYATNVFTDAAISFIERNRGEPFFLFLPYHAPHYPATKEELLQAPQEFLEQFKDVKEPHRQHSLAAVNAMDAGVGRVLAALEKMKLADHTLVIFMSDNGGSTPHGSSNVPLRGEKHLVFEGGIRVPAIVRWPGKIVPGTICKEPLISMDFFRLCLAAADASVPTDRVIDGEDPTAVLTRNIPSPHKHLIFEYHEQWAIRRGDYKLLESRNAPKVKGLVSGLYDLASDPGETTDLSTDKPELVEELKNELAEWRKEVAREEKARSRKL